MKKYIWAIVVATTLVIYALVTHGDRMVVDAEHVVETIAPAVSHSVAQKTKPQATKPVLTPIQAFHQELIQALDKVPTVDNRKQTGKEEIDSHRSPVEFADLAPVFAKIRDRAAADPGLTPEAMWFFDQCAMKSKVLSSIGSVCLHNLRVLAKNSNSQIDLSRYPQNFVRMSEKLSFAD